MAAINFPNSPTSGQVFTVGDITWTWDSTDSVWRSTTLGVHATSHELGGSDELALDASQVSGIVTDANPQIFTLMGA